MPYLYSIDTYVFAIYLPMLDIEKREKIRSVKLIKKFPAYK